MENKENNALYSVINLGNLNSFEGKHFVKDELGLTGMELSMGSMQPGEVPPFWHYHKQNEELYVVIKGEGVMSLDEEEVALQSGSVLRVSPSVKRCLRCTGSETLVYVCIQAREGSLEGYTFTDGVVCQ